MSEEGHGSAQGPPNDLAAFWSMSEQMFVVAGFDGYYQNVSPAFTRILGYPRDEALAVPFIELIHPDDHDIAERELAAAMEGGAVQAVRLRMRHHDGQYRLIEWSAQGAPSHSVMYAVGMDVTDQVRAERLARIHGTVAAVANDLDDPRAAVKVTLDAVREPTEWRVGHAYEVDPNTARASPTGVWSHEPTDDLEGFRLATEAISFDPGVGLIGAVVASGEPQQIVDLAADDSFLRREAAQALGLRSAFAFPVFVRNRVVAILEFFSSSLERLDDALFEGMDDVATQLGRTYERHERREELRASLAALESSNEDLLRFAHVASHDLKSPLTTLLGYLELALVKPDPRHIERALEGAQRMNEAIDALLATATRESTQMTTGPVDLDRLALDVLADLGHTIELTRTTVVLNPLPTTHGDTASLRILLQNLVSNAVRHSLPTGPPHLTIGGKADGDLATVWIEDNGPGIPAERREVVFEPRIRGSASGGAGLGLATCQRIVTSHGGAIRIEDSETGGTRVVIELPLTTSEPS